MSALNLEVISIQEVIFKGTCHMAVVPSFNGDAGIMHGHESIISRLKEGQITLYDEKQNVSKQIDIPGGYAEMKDADTLIVLLD